MERLNCKIRSKRLMIGVSQVKLAKEVGVNRMTISKVERGKNTDLLTALKIARALETSLSDLFELETF